MNLTLHLEVKSWI